VRPRGGEFYSPSDELPHTLRVPEDWPQDALLRTDDPEAMPAMADIAPHMSHFADPQMKELLITPRGHTPRAPDLASGTRALSRPSSGQIRRPIGRVLAAGIAA